LLIHLGVECEITRIVPHRFRRTRMAYGADDFSMWLVPGQRFWVVAS